MLVRRENHQTMSWQQVSKSGQAEITYRGLCEVSQTPRRWNYTPRIEAATRASFFVPVMVVLLTGAVANASFGKHKVLVILLCGIGQETCPR